MSIKLDHAIVCVPDKKAAAELLAYLLRVPWEASATGRFTPVYVNSGLTLDFDEAQGSFPVQHFCFRVSEEEFDGMVSSTEAHHTVRWIWQLISGMAAEISTGKNRKGLYGKS